MIERRGESCAQRFNECFFQSPQLHEALGTLWFSEGNRLAYKPVNLKPLTVDAFPPKARTY